MIRYDCAHLKRVTNNDILENNKGTLRCDVNRAAPDGTTVAGISCPEECMGYRPMSSKGNNDGTSAFKAITDAFKALIGKS